MCFIGKMGKTAEMGNETTVQEFILEGFPAVQHLGKFFFTLILLAYSVAFTGNTIIITLTWADYHLQIPMYFFLSNFSFLENCFITTAIPKLLLIFLWGMQKISFLGCLIQAFFFLFWGSTGSLLLAVMSLDRYIAICNPLRYPSIMTRKVCFLLVIFCYVASFFVVVGIILKVSMLSFCGSNVIKHFLCDLTPLTHLSCSDTKFFESLVFALAILVLVSSLIITIIAYTNIIIKIVNLPSIKERQKAFSTCSSHFIVLCLLYGSSVFIYLKPNQAKTFDTNREAALVNTVVTPLLNPFIYTLRNKQVKQALRNVLYRIKLARWIH
ncbi:olfactory receptor 6C75-like [Antechinus flavipes]|uniref:olfactory receptor 6C75-like n=1 Tax=Antechinus flavipes TaxID=38775 RepID=UPI002236168D|nr:olfactory receptor 6C75-like [Antechinus flavipes]